METRTYNVYKFNELSKEAKQHAIDKWYEHEDYPWLEEDLRQELENLDTLKLFSDVKLQYSLSCCQGDGLSFAASIDIDAWLKEQGYSKENIEALNEHIYKFTSNGNTGHYSYSSERDIEWEGQGNSVPASTEEEIETIRKEIAQYYLAICNKLEKYGYSILDYRMDFAEFEEHCENNDYMFTETGKLD